MRDATPSVPECPSCGAPLVLKRIDRGTVPCAYCGADVVLRSLPALAADPDRLNAIEERALPPTIFRKYVLRYLPIPAGAMAGFALAIAPFVLVRAPGGAHVPACVLAALAALLALAWKRRLYAIALSLAVGAAIALKPFLYPLHSYEYDYAIAPLSPDGLEFVVPGALLAALGIGMVVRIRPARFRADLALLKPGWLALAGVGAGAGIALLANLGETNADLLARHGAFLDARQQQYRAIGAWIEAPGRPPLPAVAQGLAPTPYWVWKDPHNNVEIVPLRELGARRELGAVDLCLGGPLGALLARRANRWWRDEWDRDGELGERDLPAAAATRYLVAYRCDPHGDDFPISGCRAWMFSLDTGAPLLEVALPGAHPYGELDYALLDALAAATGGTFRRGS